MSRWNLRMVLSDTIVAWLAIPIGIIISSVIFAVLASFNLPKAILYVLPTAFLILYCLVVIFMRFVSGEEVLADAEEKLIRELIKSERFRKPMIGIELKVNVQIQYLRYWIKYMFATRTERVELRDKMETLRKRLKKQEASN